MSTFLNRLTPETLAAIITDLTWQRFLSRDEACAALDTCKTCAFYTGALQDPDLVVIPSEDSKPGWILAEASVLARRRDEEEEKYSTDLRTSGFTSAAHSASGDTVEPSGSPSGDDNGVASGIAETDTHIGPRKESIEADREEYDLDLDPKSGDH